MEATPPILAALVTGGLLGLSGCVFQSVFRNPLAEPYMLGTTGGASLFAAAAMHFGWAALGGVATIPLAAFAGAVASLALVCIVAELAGRRHPALEEEARLNAPGNTVVLAGFVTGSFMGSLQMLLLSYAQPGVFEALSKWLFGNLRHVPPVVFKADIAVLAGAAVWLSWHASRLDLLALGADRAACLGVDTRRLTLFALGIVSIATAAAVATAGAIGFVGLIAPHVARRFAGERHRLVLPCSIAMGAAVLAAAECLAGLMPGDLSPGVVCATVGAPWFLFLLTRKR